MKLAVVVPFFNEEKLILDLVSSLLNQSSLDFEVVFVDNASTDNTVQLITEILSKQKLLQWQIITEKQKGTGAAADTGFNFAIEKLEATHIARTDADCVVDKYWIENIITIFKTADIEFIAGKILPRPDKEAGFLDLALSPMLVSISSIYGKLAKRGSGFLYPYMLVAGNNMAISADLYTKVGGFPRSKIDDINEDDVLAEKIRKTTKKVMFARKMRVYNSLRRLKKYGYFNTLMWYKDRSYKPESLADIDVR